MSNPLPYLVRMLLFLAAVAGIGYVLHEDLIRVFLNTPVLDSVILGVLVVGIFFVFRQVIILWPEVKWLRRFQHREEGAPPPPADTINLLAPMAAMLGERQDQIRLSPTAARAMLDGIATRLDERRELARYMIGLLIFLGLLGTFWGLLQTIGAVADAINSLQVSAGDSIQMFAKLKGSIEGPLKGMSTAFGASLFGLTGSLVLGFLELQASQAQGRFHTELEEWLARATSISASNLPGAGAVALPAYVSALLERNAEGTDGLLRALQRVEESRQSTATANTALVERLASLAETMRAQQHLLARFTELSIELREAVARLSDRSGAEADREASLAHQRNVEALLSRLIEESAHNRSAVAEEIRGVVGKVSDRSAADSDREAILAQQRFIEAQVARVADENARGRTELVDELRVLADRVADRTAAQADRDALVEQQRNIEGQIVRLTEETARHRSELTEDLRSVVARLSDRSADVAAREALIAQQRGIETQIAKLTDESARVRGELSGELRNLLGKIAERPSTAADAEMLQTHQRNIETFLARVADEGAKVRSQLSGELQEAVNRLTERGPADAERESLASYQRNIEAHLGRLVEENVRSRSVLVDELRTAIGRLSERFADYDRDAVAAHQRNIESHLARLAEENAANRSALADELRGELRLLARTVANTRDEPPPAAPGSGQG